MHVVLDLNLNELPLEETVHHAVTKCGRLIAVIGSLADRARLRQGDFEQDILPPSNDESVTDHDGRIAASKVPRYLSDLPKNRCTVDCSKGCIHPIGRLIPQLILAYECLGTPEVGMEALLWRLVLAFAWIS